MIEYNDLSVSTQRLLTLEKFQENANDTERLLTSLSRLSNEQPALYAVLMLGTDTVPDANGRSQPSTKLLALIQHGQQELNKKVAEEGARLRDEITQYTQTPIRQIGPTPIEGSIQLPNAVPSSGRRGQLL